MWQVMRQCEKKISFLGENIQIIRKCRGMKQQELADKIGINMQNLSKIERGLNYPAYETLEKIMEVLDVTPNELLSGKWNHVSQSEKEVCRFLRAEERLKAELKHDLIIIFLTVRKNGRNMSWKSYGNILPITSTERILKHLTFIRSKNLSST